MTGLYWEPFLAVFQPLGVKIEPTFMPHHISIVRVRERSCDIAFRGYVDEYPDLYYSHWPQELEEVLAVHPSTTTFKDVGSFVGQKIGWVNGYGFEALLPTDTNYKEVRSEGFGLKMLEQGRLDFFLDYQLTITTAAARIGLDLSAYTLTPVAELSQLVYPMFRPDKHGVKLLEIYNRRMAQLHKDGTLDLILKNIIRAPIQHRRTIKKNGSG